MTHAPLRKKTPSFQNLKAVSKNLDPAPQALHI